MWVPLWNWVLWVQRRRGGKGKEPRSRTDWNSEFQFAPDLRPAVGAEAALSVSVRCALCVAVAVGLRLVACLRGERALTEFGGWGYIAMHVARRLCLC